MSPPLSPARLDQTIDTAWSYEQFAASVSKWREELDLNFDAVSFEAEELAALNRLRPALDVLAIVEEWCPDVITALPILARIERDTQAIRLHVLVRPSHTSVADAYPHADGRSHIPTFVFFDASGEERGLFIERPDSLNAWVRDTFKAVVARQAGDHIDVSDPRTVPVEIRERAADTLLRERRSVRALERSELVKVVRGAGGV